MKNNYTSKNTGIATFSLAAEFVKQYPDVKEFIVIARGVNNEIAGKSIVDETKKVAAEIHAEGKKILEERRYQKWVEVYEKMAKDAGLKPGNFDASHIALTKRVLAGKDLPNINPVVNFYNLYSVKYGIPFGGENLAAVYGAPTLDISKGGDLYVGLGEDIVIKTNPGEVMWRDGHSVTCRLWNWRQSERTKLTRSTKDVYFVIDGFAGMSGVDYKTIVALFSDDLKKTFGAEVEFGVLDKDHPDFSFKYNTKDSSDVDVEKEMIKSASKAKRTTSPTSQKILQRRVNSLGLTDPNHLTHRLTSNIDKLLGEAGFKESAALVFVPNKTYGDVATSVALKLAQEEKRSPAEIAQDIVILLKQDAGVGRTFSSIEAFPNGFINFTLSDHLLLSELKTASSHDAGFGSSDVGSRRTMLIESPSINPNAAAHIGHLLNLFIGRALARLFEKVGFISKIDNLINDRGIKICMAMWGVEHLAGRKTPEELGMKSDQFVGSYYVQAKQKYAEDPKTKAEIQQMLRDWEAGKPETMALWNKTVSWAFKGHKNTFERLHEEEGYLWMESNIYKGGKAVIDKYLGRGIIEQLPDGAVIGRLEEAYGIPDVILLRADGTSLYETQDIYLTMLKVKKFKPWKAIWVVGSEQLAHFQKLFALFDSLSILEVENLYHMGYGLIVDKNGVKIGKNAADATADMVLDQMRDAALSVMQARQVQHEVAKKDEIAEAVGQGALRFAFLSKDPFRGTTYDPESALSFTGRSGPYVMYAYTRAKNVLKKAVENDATAVDGYSNLDAQLTNITIGQDERNLALILLTYPEALLSAANAYAPNVVSEYLYNVARSFNNLYEKETLAGGKGDQRLFRLLLTKVTANVLKDGLEILGIQPLEQM